jgi:hypothetical protein
MYSGYWANAKGKEELGSKENSVQKITSLLLRNRKFETENEHGVTSFVIEQCKLKTGSVYCFVTKERIFEMLTAF